jgi:hypothetical protein
MLGSYATHDDHENFDQAKKACIRIPAHPVRDGDCGLDDLCIRRLPDSHQGRSALAEGMQTPPVLF